MQWQKKTSTGRRQHRGLGFNSPSSPHKAMRECGPCSNALVGLLLVKLALVELLEVLLQIRSVLAPPPAIIAAVHVGWLNVVDENACI